ncbi:hypothetical protein EBT31_02900 [bacterium]|nr:hypothetical protein [bacterium]
MAIDTADAVYIQLSYSAALSVYSASGTLFTTVALVSTAPDICVIKYNTSGTALFAIKAGSTNDVLGGCVVDPSTNNFYVFFSGSNPTNIYDAAGVLQKTFAGGAYIIKYSSTGSFLWAVRMFTTQGTQLYNLSLTPAGEPVGYGLYTGGATSVALTFYNTSDAAVTTRASSTFNQDFIVKYDGNGTYVYNTTITGTAAGVGVAMFDAKTSGVQALAGGYSATSVPSFKNPTDTVQSTLTSIGGTDMFLARYVF